MKLLTLSPLNSSFKCWNKYIPGLTPTGVTLIPPGATTDGVTTLIAGTDPLVVILGVAAAAAARAAIPVICPPTEAACYNINHQYTYVIDKCKNNVALA